MRAGSSVGVVDWVGMIGAMVCLVPFSTALVAPVQVIASASEGARIGKRPLHNRARRYRVVANIIRVRGAAEVTGNLAEKVWFM
jgi:hypothetical protein